MEGAEDSYHSGLRASVPVHSVLVWFDVSYKYRASGLFWLCAISSDKIYFLGSNYWTQIFWAKIFALGSCRESFWPENGFDRFWVVLILFLAALAALYIPLSFIQSVIHYVQFIPTLVVFALPSTMPHTIMSVQCRTQWCTYTYLGDWFIDRLINSLAILNSYQP